MFLSVIGGFLVILGVWALIRTIRFDRRAVRTQGMVVSRVPVTRQYGEDSRVEYDVHIQYTDTAGRVHRITSSEDRPFVAVVEVLYDPDNPSDGHLAGGVRAGVWVVGTGLALIVGGFLV